MKTTGKTGLWLLDRRNYANESLAQLRRRLLEDLLGTGVADSLCYGPQGKPFLAQGPEFSLSHSGDYLLLAIAPQPVGVDIERHRQLEYRALAGRCFHPQEQALLQQAAAKEQVLFFDIWTCRESCLKATGLGLTLPPQAFRTSFTAEDRAVLQPADAAFPADFADYLLYRYPLLPGYSIALCLAPGTPNPPLQEVRW